jgi:hypothetical protein
MEGTVSIFAMTGGVRCRRTQKEQDLWDRRLHTSACIFGRNVVLPSESTGHGRV